MAKLTLLLAFHNHQPDGNFDHVFRIGYEDCYRPLLDAIAEFPRVRLALHHTGPLFEWLEANHPDYLTDLRALVERGQVELLGGGFYEPMLAVLPENDAQGQLRYMQGYCKSRFGVSPRGMWLAERVWEPALAETIARAGLTYTLTDDTHFRYAGMSGLLDGYYVTEKAGYPIAVFPIEKELRYAIPFKPADQAIAALEELLTARGGRDVVVTYGDDGEKFGMWPGTKEWVWQKGWLRDFFTRLTQHAEGGGPIVTSTFSETLDHTSSGGRVYLPTASYEEMGAWSLPAEAHASYQRVRARLEHEQRFEEIRPFFRGGVWQGFLARYPEADRMHKKMVHVSRKLGPDHELDDATRELYRAQCNCAYWHGLFGGLYLNGLRHAVYAHLIGAELTADTFATGAAPKPRVERMDFDADLRDEIILSNADLWVGIKPDAGGAFFELDARAERFNVSNVLGRHPEAYHEKLRAAAAGHHEDGGAPRSIHDLAKVKESGLEDLLRYDRHARLGLIDHFLAPGTTVRDLERVSYDERGDFVDGAYAIVRATSAGDSVGVDLRRAGTVRDAAGEPRRLTVEKSYTLTGRKLSCRWTLALAGDAPLDVWFVPELSLTLLAGDDPGRRYELPGHILDDARLVSRGALDGATRLDMLDEWSRLRLILQADGAAEFWRFPLETASQSEDGFERTYQGSVLAPVWPLSLLPGSPRDLTFHLSVTELARA